MIGCRRNKREGTPSEDDGWVNAHRGRFSVLTRQGDHDRMSRVMEDAENAKKKE